VFTDATSPASFQPHWAALGDFAVVGTEANDTLTAVPGDLWLRADGLGGDDSITGGSIGQPLSFGLFGGDGDDTLQGGGSTNHITGGAGSDSLSGGQYNDQIEGGAGSDTLLGNEDRDALSGGEGDDRIEGGAGIDRLDGDSYYGTTVGGADTLIGGGGDDWLDGNAGTDTAVFTGNRGDYRVGDEFYLTLWDRRPGSPDGFDRLVNIEVLAFADGTVTLRSLSDLADSIIAGAGDEILHGQAGDDTLRGADAADVLIGGPGGDLLAGDVGNDSLDGSDGADTLDGGGQNDALQGSLYPADYGLTCRAHAKSVSERMRPASAMRLFQAAQQASTMARVPANRRPER
jgi:hypothetical protein